jgi:uncharacterized protein (DUF924 family)
MADPQEILDFWFGELDRHGVAVEDRSELWWSKNDQLDALVKERFEADVREAAAGRRDSWATTPTGSLALIVSLDQFPRNIYRDTPEAFAHDPKARACCLQGLAQGLDRELGLDQRCFYYLPLEHAEDRALQERSVAMFAELLRIAPEKHEPVFASYLEYAERHREIIDRFGRFPHRNDVLGRASTPDELAFLKEPGSSF